MGVASYIAKLRSAFSVLALAAGAMASLSLFAEHGNSRTRTTADTLSRIDMDFGTMSSTAGKMSLDACSGTLASKATLNSPGMCRAVFFTAGHCVTNELGQVFSKEIWFRYPGERREASFIIPRNQVRVETPYVPPLNGEKETGKNDYAVVYIDLACSLIARLTPARIGPLNSDGTVAVRTGEAVSTRKRFSSVENQGGASNPGGGNKFTAAVHESSTAGVLTTEFFSPDQVGKIHNGDSGSGVTNADGELIGALAVSTTAMTTETRDADGRLLKSVKNTDPSVIERDFSFDGSGLGYLVRSLQKSKMPFDQNGALSSSGGQQLASLSESAAKQSPQHGASGTSPQTTRPSGGSRQPASAQSQTASVDAAATAAPLIPGTAFDPASLNDNQPAAKPARPVATKAKLDGPGEEIPGLSAVRKSTEEWAYVTNTDGGWSNVRILEDGTIETTDGKQISAQARRELLLAYDQSYGSGVYGDKSLLVSKAVDKYRAEIDKWKSEIEVSRLAQSEIGETSQASSQQQVSPFGPSLASAGQGFAPGRQPQGSPFNVSAGGGNLPASGARAGHSFSGKPELTPDAAKVPETADIRDTATVQHSRNIAGLRNPQVTQMDERKWAALKAEDQKLHARPPERPVHATAQADGKATPAAIAAIGKCMACHTEGSGRHLILSGSAEQALSGLRAALEKRNLGVSTFKVYEMMKSDVYGKLSDEEQKGLMAYILRTDESKSEEELNRAAIEKFVGNSTELPPRMTTPQMEQAYRASLPKTNNPILNAIFSDPSTQFYAHSGPGALARKYQDGGSRDVSGMHLSTSTILDSWVFKDGSKMFNSGILRGVLGQGFGLGANTQNFKFVWRPKVNGKSLPDSYTEMPYKDANDTGAPGVVYDYQLPVGSIVGEVVIENGVVKDIRLREMAPDLCTQATAYRAFPTAEHLASAIESDAPAGMSGVVTHLRNPNTLTRAKPVQSDYHVPVINEQGYEDKIPQLPQQTERQLASKAVFSSALGQAWKKNGNQVAYGPTGTNSTILPSFDVHSVAVNSESCMRCHEYTQTNFAFLYPGVRNTTTGAFNLNNYGMTYGNRQRIFSYEPFADKIPDFGKGGKFQGNFPTSFGVEPNYDNRMDENGNPRFRNPNFIYRSDRIPAEYADFYK